ncbi:MEDS domain-containing protein, partial [Micromonospora azadirachtae]
MSSGLTPSTPYGHVCWVYDDPAALDRAAHRFLTAGLAAGERLWYVAAGRAEPVVASLSATPA